jgi:uncharacterized membrane protein
MTKKTLLKKAHEKLEKLPAEKISEVIDYAEFLIAKTENTMHNDDLLKMAATSKTFAFVNEDEVEYTINDIKKG